MFSQVRLSPHFTLMDFMHGRTTYQSGEPIRVEDVPEWAIATGKAMCEELLEPLLAAHGPMSFSSGYVPERYLRRWTPHSWKPADGAAVDAIVHSWVNAERAPIKLVEWIVTNHLPFERLITYAGSEVICMSAGRAQNRGAIYENVRNPEGRGRPQFVTWARSHRDHKRKGSPFVVEDRPEWRRLDNEPIYHSQNSIRAQHIRVGRYHTLLDFCRDEEAMAQGKCWVPPLTKDILIDMARCMAEVLEPWMTKVGHLTVVQGLRRKDMAIRDEQTWAGEVGELTFLIPPSVPYFAPNHPQVLDVANRDTPAGTEVSIQVRRFEPFRRWSSGVRTRQR